jgi:chemotaxis signal transduction protein
MITPRNPPGRVYLSGNTILFKIGREEHHIEVPKLLRVIRHGYNETLLNEQNRNSGIISWNDEDTLLVCLDKRSYCVYIADIQQVISMRQIAAPLTELDPGQWCILGVC